MSWTDERVETLKRMWAEGQSASQIAKELGGVTRNAVIGKVHRLGLSNRNGGPAPAAAPAAKAEAPKPASETAQAAPEPVPAPPEPATVAEPEPAPETKPAPAVAPAQTARKPALPANGQPLPPQPSQGEISAEAMATVREAEKKARKLHGAIQRSKRPRLDRYLNRIERLGGRATSSVGSRTDYVVVGENPGNKLDEARKQDAEILDEKQFKKVVEQ